MDGATPLFELIRTVDDRQRVQVAYDWTRPLLDLVEDSVVGDAGVAADAFEAIAAWLADDRVDPAGIDRACTKLGSGPDHRRRHLWPHRDHSRNGDIGGVDPDQWMAYLAVRETAYATREAASGHHANTPGVAEFVFVCAGALRDRGADDVVDLLPVALKVCWGDAELEVARIGAGMIDGWDASTDGLRVAAELLHNRRAS